MSATAPTVPAAKPLSACGPFESRFRLTGLALAYVFLAVPALILLCVMTAALGVSVVGVGLVLLFAFVPLNGQLANAHRALSGTILGREIERPYQRTPPGSAFKKLRSWARDPARWRDYLWTWASVTAGWALSWIAFGLGLAVIWYAVFPFVYAVTPDGALGINYGIIEIDTLAKSLLEWVFLPIAVWLWWTCVPILMRWRAEIDRAMLGPSREQLERRVEHVSASRAESVDHSATEIRRIERDLHDGAQARLVSLGMSLGMAEQLLESDPVRAAELLADARAATTSALGDIRTVVRGIHPPVLADRGLGAGVQALALDLSIPVTVLVSLAGRPPAPVEVAAYFSIAECLANVVKHSGATHATVEIGHDGALLNIAVGDDGHGGAGADSAGTDSAATDSAGNENAGTDSAATDSAGNENAGTGLAGVARRLDALDGTMVVVSPVGGPTVITMEVPCALSSPKTMPSSGTA